jgi:hypothetical protein
LSSGVSLKKGSIQWHGGARRDPPTLHRIMCL